MHTVHTLGRVEPSSEVLGWLARAMVVAREDAGQELIDIAYHARVKEGTVERWENGEHWPRDLDAALTAYATATGRGGARAMWELALRLWREDDGHASQRVADAFDPDSPRSPGERSETAGATENPGEVA